MFVLKYFMSDYLPVSEMCNLISADIRIILLSHFFRFTGHFYTTDV